MRICIVLLLARDKLGAAYKWLLLVFFILWIAGIFWLLLFPVAP